MGKQVRKVLILTGLVSLALFGGAMTSYAIGPGENASQTAVAKPTTYNQQAVKALGNWEQQGSVWRFRCLDGNLLTNAWLENLTEASTYYYVDVTGVMLINSKTPDGYSVDANGLWRAQAVVASDGNSNESTGNNTKSDRPSEADIAMAREYFQGVSRYDGIH